MKKLLIIPMLFICSMVIGQSKKIIGKLIQIEHLEVAQNDFPKQMNWTDAKKACADLVLNGYNDWGCPSKEELEYIYKNWFKLNFYCGISAADYWSSKEYDGHNAWYFDFRKGVAEFYYYKGKDTSRRVRAVRTF